MFRCILVAAVVLVPRFFVESPCCYGADRRAQSGSLVVCGGLEEDVGDPEVSEAGVQERDSKQKKDTYKKYGKLVIVLVCNK